MTPYAENILESALDLQEYERKQIAMALIASTLTPMAAEAAFKANQQIEMGGYHESE